MYHVSFEKFLLYNCFFSYETHSFIILSYNAFIYKSFSKVSSVINVISYNAFLFFIVCSFISILYDSFIKKKHIKCVSLQNHFLKVIYLIFNFIIDYPFFIIFSFVKLSCIICSFLKYTKWKAVREKVLPG